MGAPIAIGTYLLIQRNIPLTQQVSIQNQGNFYAQATEIALDTIVMEMQQLAARTGQFRGIWATGIAYNFGDIVVDGANGANTQNYYMCVLSNTSGVWTTDLSNGDWTLIINIQQINADVAAAAASATAAAASAATAVSAAATSTTQAGIATAQAGIATTQAGVATTQAGIATTEAGVATTQAAIATAAAAAAQNINATSATSQAITTGSLTFTTQANKLFTIGEFVTIASGANVANYMHGQVTSYSGTALIVNVLDTGGTGTHSDWNIMLSGTQGTMGPAGAGTSPAGTPGQVQYYSLVSNTFAAFTFNGDATVNVASGTISVTKTLGVAFATSATTDTTNAANISTGVLGATHGGAGTVNGILKAGGSGTVTAATLGVDYQGPITLTTVGTQGTATFIGNTLNIPVYAGSGGGAGSVTNVTFTGDGTILSSTPSAAVTGTGTLTATLLSVTPKSVLSNSSTSTTTPSFVTSPVVSGVSTASAFTPTGSTTTNGLYLASANTPAIASNSRVVAQFLGGGSAVDYLSVTSQSLGNGPVIGVGSTGTSSPLTLSSLGASPVFFYANGASTLLATFSSNGNATLDVANAVMTAGSFAALGVTAPANGIYVPASNTLTITSNSHPVASFNSPGIGGDYLQFKNVASSGISAVTAPTALTAALGSGAGNLSAGNYSYKVTYVGTLGETALGSASNTVNVAVPGTNGKIALTAIPVSGSGTVTARNIYRTIAGGTTWFFLHQIADNTTTTFSDNIADTSLTFSGPASQAQIPTYVTQATTESGGDTSVGVIFNTIGTTVTGFQYNGQTVLGQSSTGDTITTGGYLFNIAGATAVKITDTYWNPNQIYPGAPNGYLVLSSGSNISGYAGAGDIISGVISVESPSYPGTVTGGVSLVIGSKGPAGQIHFNGNGALGHVTISAAQGVNPVAVDAYTFPNVLGFAGSMPGSGFNPVIRTQFGNGSGDTALGLTFYLEGTGTFEFLTDNTNAHSFSIGRTATAVNYHQTQPAATGNIPTLAVLGSDTNIDNKILAKGTGVVRINSGGGQIASFAAAPSAVNSLALNSAATGNQPSISAQNSGGNPGLSIYTSDTGPINFRTNNTNNLILTLNNNGSVQLNSGTITTYNAVSTAGLGVPAIYGYGRVVGKVNAAAAAITVYTVGAADGTFLVSGNVLVTAATVAAMTMTVTYTDEGNNSRTLALTFSQISGTLLTSITNATGTGAYEGVPLHIRCKASTSITFATVGTVTGITYNAEGMITQIA